jgi:hypothetical protein
LPLTTIEIADTSGNDLFNSSVETNEDGINDLDCLMFGDEINSSDAGSTNNLQVVSYVCLNNSSWKKFFDFSGGFNSASC